VIRKLLSLMSPKRSCFVCYDSVVDQIFNLLIAAAVLGFVYWALQSGDIENEEGGNRRDPAADHERKECYERIQFRSATS